jgi:MFS family permease
MSSTPPSPTATDAAPSGALAPFANPVFRRLWLTWFTANTCMWMNDVASAWLMTRLTTSPVMVALVATASTLPVFVLGLPCGAVADIVDRRRWFMFTQLWVATTAVLLVAAQASGVLSAELLLLLVFANGMGLAMRWPVFAAIIPELIARPQLGAALALNGVSMNLSRIVGPMVAGALISAVGTQAVYALNAVLSVAAAFAIWQWRHTPRVTALPGERFVGAMRVGLQYVRQSQPLRAVLTRVFVFFLQSTALTALLPLVAQRMVGVDVGVGVGIEAGVAVHAATAADAGTYTLLLASMGVGAIAAALSLTRWRRHFDRDSTLNAGVVAHALATAWMAWAPNLWVAIPGMLVAGAAWISVANSLTLSAQLALPDWVRARGMSIYQMALMGGSAAGAALWGTVAGQTSVTTSLWVASALALATLWPMRKRRIEGVHGVDLTTQRAFTEPVPGYELAADAGPVMVTVEYIVDEVDVVAFTRVMQESRRSRLQLGALSWGLFRDTTDPRRFVEYFVDENWTEHRRRFDRVTAREVSLREQRVAFHRGAEPPRIDRAVGVPLDS